MHRPETRREKEVKILCNKPSAWKKECIGLNGEFFETQVSTDGTSSKHKMISQNSLHLILCIGFDWLGFLPFQIFRSVHALLQFYCIFSCYLLSAKPGLRCLYSCSYTDVVCPVIEVISFQVTQHSRCLPLTWRKNIWFPKHCALYVGVLVSLWLFLFHLWVVCSTTKIIYLGWVKEVRTMKS
jgi:hypothetical protein